MRGRGLKHFTGPDGFVWHGVAPHAGARIETSVVMVRSVHRQSSLSPPMRGRGLKQIRSLINNELSAVAPHAGARIEHRGNGVMADHARVAPHAGGAD